MATPTGTTKCLAISFAKQSHVPSCAMNIFDLFMSFKYINITDQRNPWLSQAVQNCYLLGHFEPYVLLVGGSECHLQVVKLSWMRNQLKSPFGFTIDTISDAGGLLMRRVPQYMAMRLEEVICQLLWQNTQVEPSCSIEKLMTCLRNVYRDLQPRPPSYDAVRAALSALVTAGAVYFSGQGYSLLTAEKLAVAKWLENVPEVVSISEQEDEQENQLDEAVEEPRKAPLAQVEPSIEPHSGRPTNASPTCNPYASTNVLNLRSDAINGHRDYLESPTMQLSNPAVLSSMPSLDFPSSLELQARRNCSVRDKSETWNPTLRVSPPVRYRDTSIPAATLSQPTVSPPTHSERQRPFGFRSPQQTRRSKNSTNPDRSATNPLVNGNHHSMKEVMTSTKQKGQPSFVRWITQQFQRMRTGFCRQRHSKDNMLFNSLVDSHTPDSGICLPSHQKSRSVPVSTEAIWNQSPRMLSARIPAVPLGDVPSTLAKSPNRFNQLNLGRLRRCLSLAEDTNEGLSTVRPSHAHYDIPPGAPLIINSTQCTVSTAQNRSFLPAPGTAQWISHQDLATSPSYLSLVAKPTSRIDPVLNDRARLPSQSTSRLVIPCTDGTAKPWTYNHPQRHSVFATPTTIAQPPTKQRPATRDSGFAESDCTNPPRVSHQDRPVGYSASPLSKSSDGGLIGPESHSALWLNASPHSGASVWWTTGFEHAVPSIMISNQSLTKPVEQSVQSTRMIPYPLIGGQVLGK